MAIIDCQIAEKVESYPKRVIMSIKHMSKVLYTIAFIIVAITTHIPTASASTQCVTYKPGHCAFGRTVLSNSHCNPQHCFFFPEQVIQQATDCLFSMSLSPPPTTKLYNYLQPINLQDFSCLMPEWGRFEYTEASKNGCEDPFMQTYNEPVRPCGNRCCSSDLSGNFITNGSVPSTCAKRFTFQPNATMCTYDEISRGQFVNFLSSEQAGVLVAGDSMMRQLYLRLVQMMRGRARNLDYHIHTHAQYRFCDQGDIFRISNNNNFSTPSIAPDSKFLLDIVPDFFNGKVGPAAHSISSVLDHCSQQPLPLDYLHAPFYGQQARVIFSYLSTVPESYRPIVILSVGYWEGVYDVPDIYLYMLKELQKRALRVFIVTIPTVKVPSTKNERKVAYWARNEFLKDWVRKMGDPFTVLDFDLVSGAANAPPGGANNNWHYMCSIQWKLNCEHCEQIHMNQRNGLTSAGFRAFQAMGHPEKIIVTEDGHCADEMNRNLWQVMFNTLINPGYQGSVSRGGWVDPRTVKLLPSVQDWLAEEEWTDDDSSSIDSSSSNGTVDGDESGRMDINNEFEDDPGSNSRDDNNDKVSSISRSRSRDEKRRTAADALTSPIIGQDTERVVSRKLIMPMK